MNFHQYSCYNETIDESLSKGVFFLSTITDVAREAGVSVATVSRVINGSGFVAPETKQRVQEAIERLAYAPNVYSRNLRRQESRMILVLLPDFDNPFYGRILNGMEKRAREDGYGLLIGSTNKDPVREIAQLKMLDQKQADGVILLSPCLSADALEQLNERFPVVQCCEYLEEANVSYVTIDNYTAYYQLTRHLIQLGHKNIHMLSTINEFSSTRCRERAFRAALQESGLPFSDAMIRRGNYSFETGYAGAQALLRQADRPTAIMSVSDTVAAGCLSAVYDAGLRIPSDIAVTGFDDIDVARMLHPALTTVHQPHTQLGFTAIDLLLQRITSGANAVHHILLPYELILRKSTIQF